MTPIGNTGPAHPAGPSAAGEASGPQASPDRRAEPRPLPAMSDDAARLTSRAALSRSSSASMSGRAGSLESVDVVVAGPRRQALLGDYQAALDRPLDLSLALAAIQLRCAAEVYCEKNNLARFTPRPPRRQAARERLEALLARPADELIADVQAHPDRYSRTLLTDVAQHHLLAALNIDAAQYRKGIRNAARYEGLHSVAGRLVSVAAAGLSAGVSEIPAVKEGASSAMRAVKKAVKILSHELPPNVINPALTGGLRSITDVKESFERIGGLPVVAAQIDKSPDMGAILQSARERRRQLDDALVRFRRADEEHRQQALEQLVDAFVALHEVADRQYRRRIGLNRTQTYSKGWGMAVNGVAATGAVVTATVPVVGQIAGPAILAATVPLQWGAGYLDERRSKHRYNLRANTKWGDFLKPEASRIHFKDLRPEHVSEAALRKSFMTQAEVQVAAIREVYEDALGELMHRHAELSKSIESAPRSGTPARPLAPQPLREKLWALEEQIDVAKMQVSDFESFDTDRWQRIPADSLIGRCLDDLKKLEQANRAARLRKPGEGAQIVQRYVQAFHGGVSTGTSLPIVDAITAVDALYTPDAHGHSQALQPGPEAAAVAVGVGGGVVFTAATGEVRMSKADNKKTMSQLRVSPEVYEAHREQWVFRAGSRDVDLRTTAGYRELVHTRSDEFKLLGQALKHGLTSGPVGLKNLVLAKGELRQARASLRATLDALAASGLPKNAPEGRRAPTIAAMKDELYDYPAVRRHLQ